MFPGVSQIKDFVSQGGHWESQYTLVKSQDPPFKSQGETCFQVVTHNSSGFVATPPLIGVIFQNKIPLQNTGVGLYMCINVLQPNRF